MKWQLSSICLLLISCIHISYQKSTPDSKFYKAAVVEYAPEYDRNNTLHVNVAAYKKHIEEAALQEADIIVFPEDGLTSFAMPSGKELDSWATVVPSVSEKYVPCINKTIPVSETLKSLSCAAKNNSIYVVINLVEKECKTNCSEDDVLYYNCNVVFDRNGMIVARYRKTNLAGESFNTTKEPEVVTFDTDFGVKFGTFICFDILFQDPALILTRSEGIRDILYPTAWFSETPFLTALQIQAGWSYAEDVNLLASGYHNLRGGSGGSGIFLGRQGIANATMPLDENYPKLIIADVPKKPKKEGPLEPPHKRVNEIPPPPPREVIMRERRKRSGLYIKHLNLLRDILETFTTERIMNNSVQKSVCQNNFCCNFTVEITKKDPNVEYRFFVLNGLRSFQFIRTVGARICGIVQCANDTLESCGSVLDTDTTFNKMVIEATFDDYRNSWVIPATLNTSVYPLKDWNFTENLHDDHMHLHMSSNVPMNNVATFAAYSRYFPRDDVNVISVSSASISVASLLAVVITSILKLSL